LRADEDKNHELRMADVHKQVSEYRLHIQRQISEHDEGYNGQLRSENHVISTQIDDEKNRVKNEKTGLMTYFDEQRGALSQVEIMQMNLLREFK
jgi:hypothetical protein